MEDSNITGRLKAIRLTLGLNQKEFGERMGMALTTWASIEQGRNSLNERARLLLEKIYLVNPDFVNTGEGPMFLRSGQSDDNYFVPLGPNFEGNNLLLAMERDAFERRRRQNRSYEQDYNESGLMFSKSPDFDRTGRYAPCPECRQKDFEITRLQQLVQRLEDEVAHHRKIIDHLFEIQKSQNRPT